MPLSTFFFEKEEFKVFSEPANDNESRIAALVINDGDKIGRGQIDRYTDFVKEFGARGLAYIRVENVSYEGVSSPILKYLSEECIENLIKEFSPLIESKSLSVLENSLEDKKTLWSKIKEHKNGSSAG